MNLNITAYSTALFATWYFIEELGLLFDAGDGLISSLLQKSRKIENVFISHADRDHLTGLLQLNQLNAREGFPHIYFPNDSNSFRALEEFSKNFDRRVKQTVWSGMKEEEPVQINKNTFVQAVKNNHVRAAPNEHKSFGFLVYQTKAKLKEEYLALPQSEIVQLARSIGRETMTREVRTNLLAYSGDTPVENFDKWNNAQILIHEATFLDRNDIDSSDTRYNKHSSLEDVLKMVSELTLGALILGHFSSRYTHEQIDGKLKSLCKEFKIDIPVYRVLPGQTHRNILQETPVNH